MRKVKILNYQLSLQKSAPDYLIINSDLKSLEDFRIASSKHFTDEETEVQERSTHRNKGGGAGISNPLFFLV
jgi:hypothetical protein